MKQLFWPFCSIFVAYIWNTCFLIADEKNQKAVLSKFVALVDLTIFRERKTHGSLVKFKLNGTSDTLAEHKNAKEARPSPTFKTARALAFSWTARWSTTIRRQRRTRNEEKLLMKWKQPSKRKVKDRALLPRMVRSSAGQTVRWCVWFPTCSKSWTWSKVSVSPVRVSHQATVCWCGWKSTPMRF